MFEKSVLVPRFLIASDSFQGTLTSLEAGRVMAEALRESLPGSTTRCIVLADGGEGTAEALLANSAGKRIKTCVRGPLGDPVEASWALLSDGRAVIEMSAACGIKLVSGTIDTAKTTTYGVGELILAALDHGCRDIILGLGGSSTTDAGVGAACACGVRFYDLHGHEFKPVGATLGSVRHIDLSGLDPRIADCTIRVAAAVETPLCGTMGTSTLFASNKGARPGAIQTLDSNLYHLARVVRADLGIDMLSISCGGAGGGMAAGMAAFFGKQPQRGTEVILELLDFDRRLEHVDYVVTGEGCFDYMSLHGKVISGVARHCKAAGIPLIAVVGSLDNALLELGHTMGVTMFATLHPNNRPLELLTHRPRAQLARTMIEIAKCIAHENPLPSIIEPILSKCPTDELPESQETLR